jgi:hypothetical protein
MKEVSFNLRKWEESIFGRWLEPIFLRIIGTWVENMEGVGPSRLVRRIWLTLMNHEPVNQNQVTCRENNNLVFLIVKRTSDYDYALVMSE